MFIDVRSCFIDNKILIGCELTWVYLYGSKVEEMKEEKTAGHTEHQQVPLEQSLGPSANAGGETHRAILEKAKTTLEKRGFKVDLLYQSHSQEKPDGHVHLPNGEVTHLEAEHSTLSKPGKVLKNLQRDHSQGQAVILVVKKGNTQKLENIVSDPVKRRGNQQEDENGSYSYYTSGGEPFTDVDKLREAEYRILELSHAQLDEEEMDCTELGDNDREDLENFCLYREEDGFCTELETQCVLLNK